ncbi:MAG: cytochrome c-type biogenesis protein CcmH [Gammaproteobacteria bacterium]|nr:cytochrome c-type biogenesis protein CcmH [Gammaproteobacteria bacterium]
MSVARLVSSLILLLSFTLSHAAIVAFEFEDPEKEDRFKRFSEELRCLVCQNQSLADSNAELALDLRSELYTMIKNDASDDEIVSFMVDRYGDFVLYRPPVNSATWFLWFGPFLLIFVGLFILFMVIRSVGKQQSSELSDEEQEKLNTLLNNNKDNES